jgi:hypothetical protein
VAVAVAVGGLGTLGFACYRHHTNAEFRREPNMFGVIVPLVQWGVILAIWLWLVIREGHEKRAAKKQTQSA